MFPGYLVLSGVEIANCARTYAYVSHAMPSLEITDVWHGNDDLPVVTGDGTYESPLVDGAPWIDPRNPDTYNFYGLYPLAVTGGMDGTRNMMATQLSGDGAVAGLPRRSGKEIMVRGLMIAGDEAALAAGMEWLTAALEGGACESSAALGCGGGTLCYFSALPVVQTDSPDFVSLDDCIDPYHRTLYRVTTLAGPSVLRTFHPSIGAMAEVTFIIMAGVPYAYAVEQEVGEALSGSGTVIEEVSCDSTPVDPLVDPDCVTPPPPPRPPQIADSCIEAPELWTRFLVDIPPGTVPVWSDAVPILTMTTHGEAVRQVRIRFYPNPFGYPASDIEECDYCGEFIVSYIPATSTMTISGITESADVSVAGGPELSATHLLYGSAGAPFQWPLLSCGTGYLMTVDVAPEVVDDLDIHLSVAGRA